MNSTCKPTCNITNPEWCQNFNTGLRASHCIDYDCISQLCTTALECERTFEESQANLSQYPNGSFCPVVYDGWSCIKATTAGTIANVSCPDFEHLNFNTRNLATRECSSDGIWFDSVFNKSYTRYQHCLDLNSFKRFETITKVYISGYSISLIFLCVSTFIFVYFRSLRCVRNTIHKNLFLASILHNSTWLVWYFAVQQNMGTISTWSPVRVIGCKLLNTMFNYFMVCTYFWMLGEGIYLFALLVVTFISERRVLIFLIILGWVFPGLLILVYVILRILFSDGTDGHDFCWMYDSMYNWVYKIPCILSVVLNLVFLIVIVYVLVSKLHSDHSDHAAMMKTAKAIGVLVPLLGLHNLLSAFKPDQDELTLKRTIIELVSATTISFQGMIVAILFCLINNEVLAQLKKFFKTELQNNPRHVSMAMTQYTYIRPQPGNQSHQNGESMENATFL